MFRIVFDECFVYVLDDFGVEFVGGVRVRIYGVNYEGVIGVDDGLYEYRYV